MPFVVFFLILAGAAAIFVLYPHLRTLAGGVFVLFGLVLGYLVFDQWFGRDAAASAMGPEQLVLSDLSLEDGTRFQTLSGRVENTSETARLRSFDLRVRVLDCPSEDSADTECAIIAEDDGVARVDVPAGQVRDFKATIGFASRAAPKGAVRWLHDITDVRATN